MRSKPPATLVHLGPGFANGTANLHNARRAHVPIVNWIGDHAREQLALDAPLTSDIAALTGSVGWTRSVKAPGEMAEASLTAIEASLGPPGQIASLIIPADCMWEAGLQLLSRSPIGAVRTPSGEAISEAALATSRTLRDVAGWQRSDREGPVRGCSHRSGNRSLHLD